MFLHGVMVVTTGFELVSLGSIPSGGASFRLGSAKINTVNG
jgi:hypothetical protein